MSVRWKSGYLIIICFVLCMLHVHRAFAADWVLDDIYYQDDYSEDYSDIDLASASDATSSNAGYGVSLLGTYTPYDQSYSISSTVVQYMSDVLPKLGNVHYVLFRSGQYEYRLHYSKDLEYSGSVFTAEECGYVVYDTRYYTWTRGTESSFKLTVGSGVVYSDLGDYPGLSDDTGIWVIAVLLCVYMLYVFIRSMFSIRRHYI